MFVAGHRAPQLPDRTPMLHHLPESELLIQLRRLNGTPEAVLQDAELMQFFLPVLQADFAVCETYTFSRQDTPHVSDLGVWRLAGSQGEL